MRDPIETLEGCVRDLRKGDPFLPVAVVVPSHLLGSWLAPRIFADSGHLAISFVLLQELAWRVVEARALAEGLGPVPENVDLALVLASASEAAKAGETPDYLKEAVEKAGFGPALLRTLQDLAACGLTPAPSAQPSGASALDDLAPRSADPERLRLLSRSARGFGERLEKARLLDRPSLYRLAASMLPSPAIGGVVLFGLDDPPPASRAFLEAVAQGHPFAVIAESALAGPAPRHDRRQRDLLQRLSAPFAPDESRPPRSSLERVQARRFEGRLGGDQGAAAGPLDASLTVLAAAGEAMEAVEIARLVEAAIGAGVPPREIAVFLHDSARYTAPLASAFERAAIKALFVEGEPRVDPAARGLGLLLDLVDGSFERRAVMEFMTTAQVSWEGILGKDAEISPAQWDRLSVDAGVVVGLASWRERLKEARRERETRGFENDRTLRLYDSLLALIERLDKDLSAFPEEGGWGDFLSATLALLDGWIQRGRLVRERLERVITPLARFAPAPSREAFLARVRDLLATQVYCEGTLQDDRVFVASIRAARGMRFRMVVVPGLVAGTFPAIARPDPLLLDEEREALSPDLLTTRDAQEDARLEFVGAVRAAGERLVLSFPRFDTTSGRERAPSSFLLQAVEAALSRRITAAELLSLAAPGATGLGRPHPNEPDLAIDRIERDLALVASGRPGAARHLLEGAGFVGASIASERAAGEPLLTPYDGIIDLGGNEAALTRFALSGRKSSATDVQSLAACPYRYFLRRGFRLEPWEEPDRVYQLDALAFGSLYHAVAARLFAALRDEGLLPVKRASLPLIERRLREIVDEAAQGLVTAGAILNAALLGPAKGQVNLYLLELLERECAEADPQSGFVPTEFERRFEGIEVSLGEGRAITFSGFLDRVDLAKGREKQVRIIDYKTGKFDWKEGEQFRGGRDLQLAIYNRAAAQLYKDATVSEALYYHATPSARYKQKACPATPEVDATLVRILTTLDNTARAGLFAPVADSCDYCDYQAVCGGGRFARAERKQNDPRLADFRKMREIP